MGTNLWRLRSALPRLLLGLGLLVGLQGPPCAAFYLPGLAPVNFCEADRETAACKVRTTEGVSYEGKASGRGIGHTGDA